MTTPEPDVPVDPDVGASRPSSGSRQAAILAALAVGGALGAVSRYAVVRAVPEHAGCFPWATFLVNVSGSAVLGFLLILLIEQFPRGRLARLLVGTGFIGAFTTFSTFMVDAVVLVRDGSPGTAAVYVAASVVAGMLAAWLGMGAARLAVRAEHLLAETT